MLSTRSSVIGAAVLVGAYEAPIRPAVLDGQSTNLLNSLFSCAAEKNFLVMVRFRQA